MMISNNLVTLYIEDDRQSQDVLTFILTRIMKLPTPILFTDTENFCERLNNLSVKPNIIFVDIHIQPNDGYDVLNMIRDEKSYDDIPVIVISSSVMADEIQSLKRAGFNGLIGKPIRKSYLFEAIPKILQGESVWIVK